MSTGTGAPSDMGANGNGSDNPNAGAGDIDAKINKAIVNHLSRFEKKIASMFEGDSFGKVLEAHLEKLADAAVAEAGNPEAGKPVPNGGDEPQRLNLKALDEKYRQLQQRLEASEKARQAAEQQARDASMRSQVQAKLAAKIGADHPLLGTLMDSLYDVKKRFSEQDGRLGVKFQQDGYEDFKPLDEGVNHLFETEFKHLVQQSKAQNLPPAGVARGQLLPTGQQRQHTGFMEHAKAALAQANPDLAPLLLPNGTPQK